MRFFKKTKFLALSDAIQNPKDCKKLSLIFIEYNLKDKGAIFSHFINLRTLEIQADPSIYNLDDFELPEEIASLKKLKKISLLNLPFKTFPEWLTQIKSLKYLMVRGNDIDSIPDSICQLENLKTLRIENCKLNKLPSTLNQMQNLRSLGLCSTELTDLNPDLFPKNLKEISLSGSRKFDDDDLESLKKAMRRTKI
ncbi:leucine-rich repeat domain-containing protein [Chryseobacterium sp. G0201]|uniref:leucine-rich repeat domain-containing protein n=1 Tax=Chryseobacterium sp. G0201 TaxID=2487065 RepID=UPI000F4DF52B|nr:leucine-rich repeat domain-containing protein [Chryseobacterium sp. G0201]AZA52029.1 leucine-rich repeat domain-containing protein [Chryseobacterium sp. G0201]